MPRASGGTILAHWERQLFTLSSATSLVLCIGVLALWVKSKNTAYLLVWDHYTIPQWNIGQEYELLIEDGQAELGHVPLDQIEVEYPTDHGKHCVLSTGKPGTFLMNSRIAPSGEIIDQWRLLWIAFLLAALPGFWAYYCFQAAWRHSKGCCPRCGYDLRATPQRCPECGHMGVKRAVLRGG